MYCAIIIVTIAHIAATFAVVRTMSYINMVMVNTDYDQFRLFSRLYIYYIYDFISASNLHIIICQQIFSFSLQWPGGSTQTQ